MSRELREYIKQALSSGATKQEIVLQAAQAGWPSKLIADILNQYAGVDSRGFVIPRPNKQSHHIAKDIFLYLFFKGTLTVSLICLGILLSTILGQLLSPPSDGTNLTWLINATTAIVLTITPTHLFAFYLVSKDLEKHPEKRESIIRKLFVYSILLACVVGTLFHTVNLIIMFLNANFDPSSLSTHLVFLSLAILTFAYHFIEMYRDNKLTTGEGPL